MSPLVPLAVASQLFEESKTDIHQLPSKFKHFVEQQKLKSSEIRAVTQNLLENLEIIARVSQLTLTERATLLQEIAAVHKAAAYELIRIGAHHENIHHPLFTGLFYPNLDQNEEKYEARQERGHFLAALVRQDTSEDNNIFQYLVAHNGGKKDSPYFFAAKLPFDSFWLPVARYYALRSLQNEEKSDLHLWQALLFAVWTVYHLYIALQCYHQSIERKLTFAETGDTVYFNLVSFLCQPGSLADRINSVLISKEVPLFFANLIRTLAAGIDQMQAGPARPALGAVPDGLQEANNADPQVLAAIFQTVRNELEQVKGLPSPGLVAYESIFATFATTLKMGNTETERMVLEMLLKNLFLSSEKATSSMQLPTTETALVSHSVAGSSRQQINQNDQLQTAFGYGAAVYFDQHSLGRNVPKLLELLEDTSREEKALLRQLGYDFRVLCLNRGEGHLAGQITNTLFGHTPSAEPGRRALVVPPTATPAYAAHVTDGTRTGTGTRPEITVAAVLSTFRNLFNLRRPS